MTALLRLIPLKDLLYAAAIAALLGGFGWYTVHEQHVGKAREIAAVMRATKAAQDEADRITAARAERAKQAEENYDKEHKSLIDYVTLNPVNPVRLCIRAKPPGVPEAGPVVGGSVSADPAPGDVLQVPAGDSELRPDVGPDISRMLDLLARRADQISAQARELQSR